MINLHKHKYDIFSENGEDGIIEKILEISFKNKEKINTCEFGAGDILKNSNTFKLIKEDRVNFSIFIEKDLNLYNKLLNLKSKFPQIISINKLVEFKKDSENTLDKILSKNNISNDIDIMSIDIDSYDLDVYRSIENFHPKLLIIEGGRQKYGIFSEHSIENKMNSFSSIYDEISKKYFLICYNGNLFFLNKNSFSKEHVEKNYYTDDEYNYLLHCIYLNYLKRGFIKRILMNLISKSKFLMRLIIDYK